MTLSVSQMTIPEIHCAEMEITSVDEDEPQSSGSIAMMTSSSDIPICMLVSCLFLVLLCRKCLMHIYFLNRFHALHSYLFIGCKQTLSRGVSLSLRSLSIHDNNNSW